MQTDIPDLIFSEPWAVAVLTAIVLLVLAWQRTLSYTEYRIANDAKYALFSLLDGWASKRGRPLIREKGWAESSAEFVTTVDGDVRSVFATLRAAGFSPHLLATTKVRRTTDGREIPADAQLVFIHGNGQQTEAYLFGHQQGVDVYSHTEAAVYDPRGHVTDAQQAGDPRDVVRDALRA
mgnify:CR=1 FL=1